MSKYIINVEGFIVDGERYLMIMRSEQEEHAPGVLSVPGGKVDITGFESAILESTLRREIHEEVGVEINDQMDYVESSLFMTEAGEPVVDVVFLCRYRSGTPTISDPAEVGAIQWMTVAEVLSHPKCAPWTRTSIQNVEALRRVSEM